MTACIALLRGINVGKAKRIAMADLRDLVADLGGSNVRTLLNSGNVVFDAAHPSMNKLASAIGEAIQHTHRFSTAVVVISAADLDTIVRQNPLLKMASDPARHLVAFVSGSAVLASARPLLATPWKPSALALGDKAAYLWCADGILVSPLLQAFVRATREGATTRNWATVLKLQALARGQGATRTG